MKVILVALLALASLCARADGVYLFVHATQALTPLGSERLAAVRAKPKKGILPVTHTAINPAAFEASLITVALNGRLAHFTGGARIIDGRYVFWTGKALGGVTLAFGQEAAGISGRVQLGSDRYVLVALGDNNVAVTEDTLPPDITR